MKHARLTFIFSLLVLSSIQTSAYTIHYYNESQDKYAVWYWKTGNDGMWTEWMTPETDHINWYEATIPDYYQDFLFAVFDKAIDAPQWGSEKSQTRDLVYDNTHTFYAEGIGWYSSYDISGEPYTACEFSGICGDSLTWSINCDGVLTISGRGAMIDYESSPWPKYPSVSNLIIEDGVTSIGKNAFNGLSINQVTIPTSVTSIGKYAFMNCNSLTTVSIPEGVKSIETDAFSYCIGLLSISISSTVTTIGDMCIYGCPNLESIVVDARNTKYDSRNNCNAIIHTSNNRLIAGCQNTIIPNDITGIGPCAFWGTGLESAILPNGLQTIEHEAFGACNLQSVNIPSSVNRIEEGSFCANDNLQSIIVDPDNTIYDSRDNCNAIIESKSNTLIVGCPKTVIPNSVTRIGQSAFTISGITSLVVPEGVTQIEMQAFNSCTDLIWIELPNSLEYIVDDAFIWCPKLVTIILHAATPPRLGTFAFNDLDKSKCRLYVPEESIAAYQESDGWNEFTNIRAIGDDSYNIDSGTCGAEGDGSNLTWELSIEGVLTISGSGEMKSENSDFGAIPWYQHHEVINTVIIQEGVTSIGGSAIYNCGNLTSLTIPRSVTSIGNYAFAFCNGLTSIIIPDSVTSIGDGAFQSCYSLTNVTIPNRVKSIGDGAFQACLGLTSVTIPISVTNIGIGSFAACSGLTNIVVENGNPAYDSRDNCNAIIETASNTLIAGCQNTIIPNTITSIGGSAFNNNYLTRITIPNSVTRIGEMAFAYCFGITSITCEAIMPPICGVEAFAEIDKSMPLYVPFQSIETYQTDSTWGEFTNILAIGSEPQPVDTTTCPQRGMCGDSLMWVLGCDSVLTITGTGRMDEWNDNNPMWNAYREQIKHVTISDGVSNIAPFAFNGCSNLTGIDIPNSVTFIGEGAFMYCYVLKDITLPKALTSIETQVFCECRSITKIDLPQTITSIGEQAFALCENLRSIVIPAGVNNIGSAAFAGTNLDRIIVENGNTVYDSRGNCNAIIETATNTLIAGCKNTVIPNTVTAIAPYSLAYTLGLKRLSIPNSVTNIGEGIFQGCEDLVKVSFMGSSAQFDDGVFNSCTALAEIVCYVIEPPYAGPNTFLDVNKSAIIYVPEESVEAYTKADGWSEFANIWAIVPPTVSVFGQDVVINDSTGTGEPEVDILGDSTLVYNTDENTLTFNNLTLEVGDSVSTAITYAGTEPLTIVLNDSSTIIADTVIVSSADVVITGDGTLIAEGIVPIVGTPEANITFDSVNMYVHSLPTPASVRRRIRGGKRVDETGGPALSGFGSADFNKTEISPSGAEYSEVTIGTTADGDPMNIYALHTNNPDGTQTILTEFTLTAIADDDDAVENIGDDRSAAPQKVLIGGQVYILRDGKKYNLQGQEVR